jgi:hypothetical protein
MLAVALGYTPAPVAGSMAALALVSGSVRLVNVPRSTEGVALMQSDVAGTASAPAVITCAAEEVMPTSTACTYSIANSSRPIGSLAAQDLVAALGKRLVTFGSQQEYDDVRSAVAGTRASALISRGLLVGLWVDMAGSTYRPPGYVLPGPNQASLLAGSALTPTNVPVAGTVAGVLVEKCSELDDSVGEPAACMRFRGLCTGRHVRGGRSKQQPGACMA